LRLIDRANPFIQTFESKILLSFSIKIYDSRLIRTADPNVHGEPQFTAVIMQE